jgi:hypothetical protein
VLIQVPKSVSNVRVGVDFLEGLIRLQVEELAELVQGANVPLTGLVDTQDFHGLESLRDMTGTEGA